MVVSRDAIVWRIEASAVGSGADAARVSASSAPATSAIAPRFGARGATASSNSTPTAKPSHAERASDMSRRRSPAATAGHLSVVRKPRTMRSATVRNCASGPGAFIVLKTRTRSGSGSPIESIRLLIIHRRSHCAGITNCATP